MPKGRKGPLVGFLCCVKDEDDTLTITSKWTRPTPR